MPGHQRNCVAMEISVPLTDGKISGSQQMKVKFEMPVSHLPKKNILYIFNKYGGFLYMYCFGLGMNYVSV